MIDPLVLWVILLAGGLLAARVALLWWRLRGALQDPMPWDERAFEDARREARELQRRTKEEPGRQLEDAKRLGSLQRPRPPRP